MYDKDFLQWIHGRLKHIYNVDPQADYMTKLTAIINATPDNQLTPNVLANAEADE